MKSYSVFSNISDNARILLENNGIDVVYNDSDVKPNGEELRKLIAEYDILIIGISSKITVSLFDGIEGTKIIATNSIGLDHIDEKVFELPNVNVVNIKYANCVSVAEHIFALILALKKRIYESNFEIINGRSGFRVYRDRPEDIFGKTLGLIGAGNIAREVAKMAKAFNMRLICWTPNPEKHRDFGVEFVSFDELLKISDVINVSIRLNEQTKNLISMDKIAIMKPNATFINTSRADIVDNIALIEYADENPNFYVGLDIDLDGLEDLLGEYRPNVIVTHHTAGVSKQALERMYLELAENIVALV